MLEEVNFRESAVMLHHRIAAVLSSDDLKKVEVFLKEFYARSRKEFTVRRDEIYEVPMEGGRAWITGKNY